MLRPTALQVSELQAALNNHRPAAVADVLAAAAAQQRAAQLEVELEQQQQQHNDSLRVLHQQYEALKLRLEEQDRQLQVRATLRGSCFLQARTGQVEWKIAALLALPRAHRSQSVVMATQLHSVAVVAAVIPCRPLLAPVCGSRSCRSWLSSSATCSRGG